MAIGVTNFPGALDTVDTLVQAKNLVSATTVSDNPLTNVATTVNVASASAFPTTGTISIENEVITYTGTTATSFTGCTRGADGTTAASHVSGTAVQHLITALHHTVLRDAILAVETSLIGTGSFPASPVADQNCFRNDLGARYRAWLGSGTVTTAITGTGSQTVTTVAAHNLAVGDLVTVGANSNVAVTAVPSTTQFTASFGSAVAGSTAYTAVAWRQMGDAFWATSALAPAAPPTGYRYVNLTDSYRYRWSGSAYQKYNTAIKQLDYADSTTRSATPAANTPTTLTGTKTFTVEDANSQLEFLVDAGVFASNASGSVAQPFLYVTINSVQYYFAARYLPNGTSDYVLGSRAQYFGTLPAGTYNAEIFYQADQAATMTFAPGGTDASRYQAHIQIIEHKP